MKEAVNFDRLLHQSSLTFQKSMGHRVVFFDPVVIKSGSRSLVVRCQVTSADSGISSIIIKQIQADAARGFSDWASLAFLSELPEAQGIIPRFYGGDISSRIFLMQDLGEAESLQDLLIGANPAAARAAVQTLAEQMARLHAATLDKQAVFEAIRAALPETEELGRHYEARRWLDNREKLLSWFKAVDCVPPSSLDICLKRIATVYDHPDGFLGFTHGDPAPSNNLLTQGRAHLLDFEYGGFRHVLYDITAWNILCPLPIDWVHQMSRCFREELAKTYPAARDEAQFAEAWAYLCAYRALAILTWISPNIISQNRPWADNWAMREAVLTALSRLEQATAPFTPLEPVREAAATLTAALRSLWPELERVEGILPQWPALKISEKPPTAGFVA